MQRINLNVRRKTGYSIGVIIVTLVIISLILPQSKILHANGPSNTGHKNLKCRHCHTIEVGTIRQRLQANIQYLFGQRTKAVSFGLKPVSNEQCIFCHDRPNDRHPVYRFFEPKYKKIQKLIQPQFCISCHIEHSGKRVTSKMDFCKNCHSKLKIKKDPVTKTHQKIVLDKDWSSCLGCHDYHGNHRMKVNKIYKNRISKNKLAGYFNSMKSPYSKSKFYKVPANKLED
ncbi:MAG: cytochrome c3 family protein [Thiohalomonadales bacterium]